MAHASDRQRAPAAGAASGATRGLAVLAGSASAPQLRPAASELYQASKSIDVNDPAQPKLITPLLQAALRSKSRPSKKSVESMSYMEKHQVIPFVERSLRVLVRDAPPDPWFWIAAQLPEATVAQLAAAHTAAAIRARAERATAQGFNVRRPLADVRLWLPGVAPAALEASEMQRLAAAAALELSRVLGSDPDAVRDRDGAEASLSVDAQEPAFTLRGQIITTLPRLATAEAAAVAVSNDLARSRILTALQEALPSLQGAASGKLVLGFTISRLRPAPGAAPRSQANAQTSAAASPAASARLPSPVRGSLRKSKSSSSFAGAGTTPSRAATQIVAAAAAGGSQSRDSPGMLDMSESLDMSASRLDMSASLDTPFPGSHGSPSPKQGGRTDGLQ